MAEITSSALLGSSTLCTHPVGGRNTGTTVVDYTVDDDGIVRECDLFLPIQIPHCQRPKDGCVGSGHMFAEAPF
ncbi:hypothetical protein L207DRAFT_517386 [Hyaloscypha variabilis F]|uniref:Uncharacterized protein n=1 Tax=Hyaloscypha variabilis (strain UAMH 11265 / GT02V1 / F) TaxID=1149755 RepID=A0A2J6R6N6_HYAVF|nr:hypothetical protein L207DRAFT_517386 [Hyaloscypha variabilis F]